MRAQLPEQNLDGSADHRTLAVLARHKRLVVSAITIATIADRNADDVEQILDALASRAVIEQAKGAIMMLRRCECRRGLGGAAAGEPGLQHQTARAGTGTGRAHRAGAGRAATVSYGQMRMPCGPP
ncbi:ANTAR domain-containing protein [Amycolatopsis sp. YIM 10]|uniref:ANTAR domain-containing protein n=1 Tax=Amycolatopsis sp. YIM 10 TaxID=2653857 RepID=UPI0021075FC5|nr:ANTAR domain-containing protein [Amycolatopsis sp. YIM 10]